MCHYITPHCTPKGWWWVTVTSGLPYSNIRKRGDTAQVLHFSFIHRNFNFLSATLKNRQSMNSTTIMLLERFGWLGFVFSQAWMCTLLPCFRSLTHCIQRPLPWPPSASGDTADWTPDPRSLSSSMYADKIFLFLHTFFLILLLTTRGCDYCLVPSLLKCHEKVCFGALKV